MTKVSSLLVSFLTLVTFIGCANEEQSDLFEAQICIDNIDATQSTAALSSDVDACLSKISGQTSNESFVLRCAGDFLKQGIAETALVNAIQDLDNEGGDSTAATMEVLKFDTTANSAAAVSNCSQSGSTALTALANLANISTVVDSFKGGAANIQDYVDNYNPATLTDTEKAEMADAIIASQESLCSTDQGIMEGNEVCQNIDSAVGSGATTDAEKAALLDAFMANAQN